MKNNETKAIAYVAGIIIILLLGIAAFGIIVDLITPSFRPGQTLDRNMFIGPLDDSSKGNPFREDFGLIGTVLSSINIILLSYLLFNYLSVYFQVKSNFTLGLAITGSALLAHSIASNPLIHNFFGFRGFGLGPFTIIPSLFTLITVGVLIYLSRQ